MATPSVRWARARVGEPRRPAVARRAGPVSWARVGVAAAGAWRRLDAEQYPDTWLEDSFDLPGSDVPRRDAVKPRDLLTSTGWCTEAPLPEVDLG